MAPDDQQCQRAHRQQRFRFLPGQQRQGQGRSDKGRQRAGAGQVERQQPGADGQQRGGRIQAQQHAGGGGNTFATTEAEIQREQVTDHGAHADPRLILQRKAGSRSDQHRHQAFAQITQQGQDRQFATGQAQHVGGTGITRATHSRIRVSGQAAEQNGEGQRAEQVGESRQ
ncbi:hypothetical protein D3C72_633070 [compost metagenome]